MRTTSTACSGLLLSMGFLTALAALASAGEAPPRFPGLGSLARPVTTSSPEAQTYFNQGLALLYGFNHDEASRSFAHAAELDPHCAMAYWGVALANCPHINQTEVPPAQTQRAVAALESARKLAPPASPVEQALIAALAARVADPLPADRQPLERAYAEAMRGVWQQFPEDADVGVLFAESLMNLRPWDLWSSDGQPRPETPEVLATLEAVLKRAPEHPQALHLYIHAVEASPQPDRAMAEADRLRLLQPGLGHLVHMPSHIDVRLGHWAEAVVANQRAVEADRAYRELAPQQGFYHIYMAHNQHMLAFAAMMRGQSRVAIEAIEGMVAGMPQAFVVLNAPVADGYLSMPLEVLIRFGKWDEILAVAEPPENLPISRALRLAARGIARAARGEVELAQDEEAAFAKARALVPADRQVGHSPATQIMDLAEHLLAGEILYRAGHADEAFRQLRQAVEIEDQLKYDEPPDWIHPVRHALGATLLAAGRAEEAEQVYREDLRRNPQNGWALLGLSEALVEQGREEEARPIRLQFAEAWRDADVKISSSCFCQPQAAGN